MLPPVEFYRQQRLADRKQQNPPGQHQCHYRRPVHIATFSGMVTAALITFICSVALINWHRIASMESFMFFIATDCLMIFLCWLSISSRAAHNSAHNAARELFFVTGFGIMFSSSCKSTPSPLLQACRSAVSDYILQCSASPPAPWHGCVDLPAGW